jgi:hypothetical protein
MDQGLGFRPCENTMIKIALAALLTGCISGPLAAQSVTDIASDTELFVAYCLGRDQQTQNELKLTGIASANEVITRDFFQRIAQLHGYLHAHGLDTGERSVLAKTGVADAMLRGRADASTCWATIERCVTTCTKPQPAGYDKQCSKDCVDENPACRSGWRCSEELQLPP